MSKYNFYEEEDSIKLKYKIGDSASPISQIENYSFIFTYDYISLNGSELCFDNKEITNEAFIELYRLKKELSNLSISQVLYEFNKKYRVHPIDLYKKKKLIEPLKALFNYKKYIDLSSLPTIYQVDVYTDSNTKEAPRLVGFFGYYAVFHVLWFDFHHSIYPCK